jgi:hypothetical protein
MNTYNYGEINPSKINVRIYENINHDRCFALEHLVIQKSTVPKNVFSEKEKQNVKPIHPWLCSASVRL